MHRRRRHRRHLRPTGRPYGARGGIGAARAGLCRLRRGCATRHGFYIMFVEILPNMFRPSWWKTTVRLGYAIFTVATLSFIGFGIQPPSAGLGPRSFRKLWTDQRRYLVDGAVRRPRRRLAGRRRQPGRRRRAERLGQSRRMNPMRADALIVKISTSPTACAGATLPRPAKPQLPHRPRAKLTGWWANPDAASRRWRSPPSAICRPTAVFAAAECWSPGATCSRSAMKKSRQSPRHHRVHGPSGSRTGPESVACGSAADRRNLSSARCNLG